MTSRTHMANDQRRRAVARGMMDAARRLEEGLVHSPNMQFFVDELVPTQAAIEKLLSGETPSPEDYEQWSGIVEVRLPDGVIGLDEIKYGE